MKASNAFRVALIAGLTSEVVFSFSSRCCSATSTLCLTPAGLAAFFRSAVEVGTPWVPSAWRTWSSARGTTIQIRSAISPARTA